jgi:hypothetical protein
MRMRCHAVELVNLNVGDASPIGLVPVAATIGA